MIEGETRETTTTNIHGELVMTGWFTSIEQGSKKPVKAAAIAGYSS
jgi:hypothetical protein